jgi:hypothetical protein
MPSPYPVVTDDTVLAALQAHVGESLPRLSDYAPNLISHMRYAVDAAVRHLVDTGALTRTPLIPDPDATAAYQRGLEAGRAEQVTITLEVTSGPTGYEVWRDALQLAIANINDGESLSLEEMLSMAEWFHDRLKAGPPQPSEPDCPHCGADSSMDHNDDCPNADDGRQADEDPTDDEVDCVRCGAPPGSRRAT